MNLFGQEALHTVMHPNEKTAIMQAQVSSKPSRMPSMARREVTDQGDLLHVQRAPPNLMKTLKHLLETSKMPQGAEAILVPVGSIKVPRGQFLSSIDNIIKSISPLQTRTLTLFSA